MEEEWGGLNNASVESQETEEMYYTILCEIKVEEEWGGLNNDSVESQDTDETPIRPEFNTCL